MIQVLATAVYKKWLKRIKDNLTLSIISARTDRLKDGNFGDAKPVGEGVFELRIHYGPGYRIYFTRQGETIVLLLCGGDKSTQEKDIKKAREMLKC